MQPVLERRDGAVARADQPDRVGPAAQHALGLLGRRGRREVQVAGDVALQQRVAHAAADEVQLVPGGGEALAQGVGQRRVHQPCEDALLLRLE